MEPISVITLPDFKTLFESSTGLYIVLTPDFRIAAVSDSHLISTLTKREDVLGRDVFVVFPDNPNDPTATGTVNLRASLNRVLTQRTLDTMPIQKYDIQRPDTAGGGFEERYWKIVNSPVFGPDKTITYIINHAEDVTEQTRLSKSETAQKQALGDSEERYRLLVEGVKDYAIFMLDPEGRVITWNEGAERAHGYTATEIIGQLNDCFFAPEDQALGKSAALLKIAKEEGRVVNEGWRMRKDGSRFWADVVITAVRDREKRLIGFSKVSRDLTERKKAETDRDLNVKERAEGITEQGRLTRVGSAQKQALGESEERYRLLVEGVKDYAIFMLDPEGHVLTWNEGAERAKGYTAEEIIGQSNERFYSSEDKSLGKPSAMLQTAKEEGRVEVEGWMMRKDGSRFWADVVITAVLNREKRLIGFSEVSRDLTERKRAEMDRDRYVKERAEGIAEQGRLTTAGSAQKVALGESEERYRLLVEGVKDYAIFMLDKAGQVLTWNDGAERAKGYTAAEIIGHTIECFYTAEDQALGKPAAMLKTAEEQDRVEDEGWMMRKDGTKFWADVVITTVRNTKKELIGYSEVSRDLSERKRAETDRERSIKELAASNVELQQFAYVASHDLQEPLRMITSYTQLLSRRYKGKLDAEADEFILFATDGAARMQRLIEDLLTYSRLGTNKVPFMQVDSNNILQRALKNLSVMIQESGATVTSDLLPSVVAVETQFLQLIQNLVGNAIKYHGAAPPQVHVSAQQKDSEWVFSIRDNGIGLDPQYAERIFVIFQRLHTTETYAGTGIGLAVCKKIVERQGGRIWVESQPGQGATFYFTVPIKGDNKIGNAPRS